MMTLLTNKKRGDLTSPYYLTTNSFNGNYYSAEFTLTRNAEYRSVVGGFDLSGKQRCRWYPECGYCCYQ